MRIYYGWWTVGIGMLLLMLTVGTTTNAYTLFIVPVSRDFNLSRANVNSGIILVNVGMALFAPFVGRALDIFPVRRILVAGALLFGGSLVTLGLSHNIWLSAFALAVPLAIGIAAVGTLTATSLVARWFTAQRGRAMAIAMMGMSIGTMVMTPLIGMLIEAIGWRNCEILLGCVLAGIFLLLSLFVRDRPRPQDIEPIPATTATAPVVPAGPADKPLSLARLLRLPQFWAISLGASICLGTMQATVVSLSPLVQGRGFSLTQSATLLSLFGASAIVAKLLLAWLGDRLDRGLALPGLFAVIALASAGLMLSQSFVTLVACSFLLGLAAGAVMPLFLALLADRIGAASFGTANGTASLLIAVFAAIATRFAGEVYDRTGSYDLMFITFIGAAILSALLLLMGNRAPAPRVAHAQ